MNIIKKLLLLVIFSSVVIFGQAEYVSSDHIIYPFLERMESIGIITSYNSFEIPKTRKEIAQYIIEIKNNRDKLNSNDSRYLDDLLVEFEYDISGTLVNSEELIGGDEYHFFSDKERYLYYSVDPGTGNLFINLIGQGEGIYYKQNNKNNYKSFLGILGGQIRGTIDDKVGFFIKGTNGKAFGDREASLRDPDLRSNFKFIEAPGESFFDKAEGYITGDFKLIKVKLGRDKVRIGYSSSLNIIDNTAALFDYVGMNIKYGILEFSYMHAQLQGNISYTTDTVTGGSYSVTSKYLGYHRLGFNLSQYFNFGVGEFIVYGDRSPDLAYINPFNFYKSAEHSGKDRDNAMIFLDMNSIPFSGTKLYGTLLLDDIKISEIGKGWYGNQVLFNAGIYTTIAYKYLPLEMRFEYQHVEPYVFTHRLIRNNFTNSGYTLGRNNVPNSGSFYTELRYTINSKCIASIDFSYIVHGMNRVAADDKIMNYGGDINLGFRTFDQERIHFLDGDLEYQRITGGAIYYEPYNNLIFNIRVNYLNRTENMNKSDDLESFFLLSVRI